MPNQSGTPVKIIAIGGDPRGLHILQEVLREAPEDLGEKGFEVITTRDANEALELVIRNRPPVVLLDCNLDDGATDLLDRILCGGARNGSSPAAGPAVRRLRGSGDPPWSAGLCNEALRAR